MKLLFFTLVALSFALLVCDAFLFSPTSNLPTNQTKKCGSQSIAPCYIFLQSDPFTSVLLGAANTTTWNPLWLEYYVFPVVGNVTIPEANIILQILDTISPANTTGELNVVAASFNSSTIIENSLTLPNGTVLNLTHVLPPFWLDMVLLAGDGWIDVSFSPKTFSFIASLIMGIQAEGTMIGLAYIDLKGSGSWSRTPTVENSTSIEGINYLLDGTDTAEDFWMDAVSLSLTGMDVSEIFLRPAGSDVPLPTPTPVPGCYSEAAWQARRAGVFDDPRLSDLLPDKFKKSAKH
mgnify:CR=1 FL=1